MIDGINDKTEHNAENCLRIGIDPLLIGNVCKLKLVSRASCALIELGIGTSDFRRLINKGM